MLKKWTDTRFTAKCSGYGWYIYFICFADGANLPLAPRSPRWWARSWRRQCGCSGFRQRPQYSRYPPSPCCSHQSLDIHNSTYPLAHGNVPFTSTHCFQWYFAMHLNIHNSVVHKTLWANNISKNVACEHCSYRCRMNIYKHKNTDPLPEHLVVLFRY